jgi:formamidopyrimidine-DNA glycosylase
VPELPDVEGFRRYWARHAAGRRIRGVGVPAPDMLRDTTPQGLSRALRGRRFSAPRRHGKWLIAPAAGDGPTLLLHFGMTGGLHWSSSGEGHRFDRVVFELTGGRLGYHNMRKLGGVWLARNDRDVDRITGPLGPDAATLGREGFEELLESRRGGIKAALMNQRLLAGVGNELSDEILWQARIHPATKLPSLDRADRGRLFRAMQRVIKESNRHGRIPRHRRWITSQRGAPEPHCPRCHGELRRTKIAGRTSYWCPTCQRE